MLRTLLNRHSSALSTQHRSADVHDAARTHCFQQSAVLSYAAPRAEAAPPCAEKKYQQQQGDIRSSCTHDDVCSSVSGLPVTSGLPVAATTTATTTIAAPAATTVALCTTTRVIAPGSIPGNGQAARTAAARCISKKVGAYDHQSKTQPRPPLVSQNCCLHTMRYAGH